MDNAVLDGLRRQLVEEHDSLVMQLKDLGVNPETGAPDAGEFGNGFADSAQATAEKAGVLALAESLVETLREVNAALRRMDEGKFGTCESCGTEIPVERLEARPYARLCVKCKQRG